MSTFLSTFLRLLVTQNLYVDTAVLTATVPAATATSTVATDPPMVMAGDSTTELRTKDDQQKLNSNVLTIISALRNSELQDVLELSKRENTTIYKCDDTLV